MKVGFANREEGKTLVWLDRLRVGKMYIVCRFPHGVSEVDSHGSLGILLKVSSLASKYV